MKLDNLDLAVIEAARDGSLPMSELWRLVGQELTFEGFRYRCDRLARAGLVSRRKQWGRIFIGARREAMADV